MYIAAAADTFSQQKLRPLKGLNTYIKAAADNTWL
jgi:hypothetical protein